MNTSQIRSPFPPAVPAPDPGRRRDRPGVVALVVIAATVVVLTGTVLGTSGSAAAPAPVDGAGRPSFPAQVAGPLLLTASAEGAPAGRAIALVSYYGETLQAGRYDPVVVGADGDSYRTLPRSRALLAPDGRSVALGAHILGPNDGTLRLLDLTTGAARTVQLESSGEVDPLAFSPDGRRLVYETSVDDTLESSRLKLLQLDTGQATTLLSGRHRVAAFSPDGDALAAQLLEGGPIQIMDAAGRQLAELDAGGAFLAGKNAWSPDGSWLAMRDTLPPTEYRFLAAGPGRQLADRPAPLTLDVPTYFLGWRSTDRIVLANRAADWDVVERGPAPPGSVTVWPLRGGAPTVLMTLPNSSYAAVEHVASDLLREAVTRPPAAPDRGPWPRWARLAPAAAVFVTGMAVVLVAARRRRRAVQCRAV